MRDFWERLSRRVLFNEQYRKNCSITFNVFAKLEMLYISYIKKLNTYMYSFIKISLSSLEIEGL